MAILTVILGNFGKKKKLIIIFLRVKEIFFLGGKSHRFCPNINQ